MEAFSGGNPNRWWHMGDRLELEQSNTASRSASLVPVGVNEIRDELDRILSSQTFRAAEREKTFLRYVVERTVQGQAAQLKEYTIGVEAFERGDSIRAATPSFVRKPGMSAAGSPAITKARARRIRFESSCLRAAIPPTSSNPPDPSRRPSKFRLPSFRRRLLRWARLLRMHFGYPA